jgi:hypothetical protein
MRCAPMRCAPKRLSLQEFPVELLLEFIPYCTVYSSTRLLQVSVPRAIPKFYPYRAVLTMSL